MVDSQTTARTDAMKAAGDVARTAIERLIKDAVAEAMQEFEEERGTTSSTRRRIPAAIVLIGVGALLGYVLATRREGGSWGPEVGRERPTERMSAGEPAPGTRTDEAATPTTEADEEQADPTASD